MSRQDTSLSEKRLKKYINRTVILAKCVLLWEEIWPKILLALCVLGLFLVCSWFEIWSVLPFWLRTSFVLSLAIIFLLVLWPLHRIKWPDRSSAIKRIEKDSLLLLRPLTNFEDQPAFLSEATAIQLNADTLWKAHQERILKTIRSVHVQLPRPKTHRMDPYAIRSIIVLLLVVGFNYAGEDRLRRILATFNMPSEAVKIFARLDAWVIPPEYTNRATIFLTDIERNKNVPVEVPVGSIVKIQTTASQPVMVKTKQGGSERTLSPITQTNSNNDISKTFSRTRNNESPIEQYEINLTEDSTISVEGNFSKSFEWSFSVIPDSSPQISLNGLPKRATSGAIELSYNLNDDYGIIIAEAHFEQQNESNETTQPLYEAPNFKLSLPGTRITNGQSQTIKNLTEHPWAGLPVQLRLMAQDEARQKGWSKPHNMTLPSRNFQNPLAKALVEQRQKLALDTNNAPKVLIALDAILFAPEIFIDDISTFLAIDAARRRLTGNNTRESYRDIVDLMWQTAISIENGEISDFEQALRQAQDALRKALENNASEEEIARRVENLRKAMDQYFQALAQNLQNSPNTTLPSLPNSNFQTVTPEDFNNLLDSIENLAQSGSRDSARELLSQMERMLENLQTGVPQLSEQQSTMQNMLDNLDSLMQRERELMEETFRQQQNQQTQQGEQGPLSDAEREEVMRQLQQGQSDLHEGLQQFMEQMQDSGLTPNTALKQAERSMGDAANALGQGQSGEALSNQSDALQSMQNGLQNMIQQFAEQQNQNNADQQMGYRRGNRSSLDPLGRPRQGRLNGAESDVQIPDELDIQRAREILNSIRNRLNYPDLPKIELEYLERLLSLQ